MNRPALDLGEIFRQAGPAFRTAHLGALSAGQRRAMRAIEACRTASLGGHVEACDHCGRTRVSYNSCRNRHCPKCQSLAKAAWLAARQAELLPVPYFHVVFTLPDCLAPVALHNPQVVYHLLFHTASQTLLRIAADPRHLGADIGFLAVLHTWGSTLLHHPHLHCVVPGGGLAPDGTRWIACRKGFFLPVKVLSQLFRRLFLTALAHAADRGQLHFKGALAHLAAPESFAHLLAQARRTAWVVYAKPPFGGPDQVLAYLGRYTHRVAISNSRLVAWTNDQVSFRWKDYRDAGTRKVMTLDVAEFIRRFLLHVLPSGFQRIRHFGFLSNRQRAAKLALARSLLGAAPPPPAGNESSPPDWRRLYQRLTGLALDRCPFCQQGHMVTVEILPPLAAAHPLPATLDSS